MNIKGLAKKAFGWLGGDERWSGLMWAPTVIPSKENDANTNSIVMACVFWAMRNVVQAIPVVERFEGGGWKVVPDHPVTELLRNPQARLALDDRSVLTGRKLLSSLTYSRMLDGNSYVLKIRNDAGIVIGLDWLPHGSVRAVGRGDRPGVASHYEVASRSGWICVDAGDVIHDMDGVDPGNLLSGMSRLKCLMRQVMTDNQIAAYCQSIMRSPVPSFMVSVKGDRSRISQEDADALAKRFAEKTSGEKVGGVIVPTFDAEITPVGYRPDEMAIEAMNRLPEERITAVFGIPALVLGLGSGLGRATYSNLKESREAAVEEFLVPLWQELSSTFTNQLLREYESGSGWRVRFDTSEVAVLQEDRHRLHARVRADLAAGIIDAETARRETGRGFGV